MKTHEHDPTTDDDVDPWTDFQNEVGGLGEQLKDTYRKVASEGGPSEQEIKDAFGTLLGAWNQVAESVSTALKDPELREHLKAAASSFASAVGKTIIELGSELRDAEKWKTTSPDGSEEE